MPRLRAAVVTDIHFGLDVKDKLGTKAPKLMEHFVKAVNKFGADIVIDMGDRISATDHDTDAGFMKTLKGYFNRIAAPVISLIGNHDVVNVSRQENEEITGSPSCSHYREENGIFMIYWNPAFVVKKDGLELDDNDIEWLRNAVTAGKGKPAILFSHVPLDALDGEEVANVSKYFFWTQAEQVRHMLEDSGNVILCMHGHRHRNRYREINGIHYITQQSLTNKWKERYRVTSGTYSFMEIDDENIRISLKGKTKINYEIPIPHHLRPEPAPAPVQDSMPPPAN